MVNYGGEWDTKQRKPPYIRKWWDLAGLSIIKIDKLFGKVHVNLDFAAELVFEGHRIISFKKIALPDFDLDTSKENVMRVIKERHERQEREEKDNRRA